MGCKGFSETDSNIGLSEVYELRSVDLNSTQVHIHTYLRGKIFKPLIFSLFFKRKFISGRTEFKNRLNDYCKNMLVEGKDPNVQIVIK